MKLKYFLFVSLFSFLAGTSIIAQESDQILNRLQAGFEKGSASDLAVWFNSTIDLEIPNSEGSYQSKQAEIILEKFFEKHPVKSFKLNHKGSSDNGSKYMIGTYTSAKSFRVYVLLKLSDAKLRISNIQFEED